MTLTPPDGAFEIGGGFGQDYTEDHIRSLFTIPTPNSGNALEVLRAQLLKLPVEWLKYFQDKIPHPGGSTFDNVGSAVDAIMGAITHNPLVLLIDGLVQGLKGWIDSGFQPADVKSAAEVLASSISDMSAIIANLQQEAANGSFSGNAVNFNFTAKANNSTLGSEFTQTNSGTGTATFGISNGYAAVLGTATNRLCTAIYTQSATQTSYQKIGAVFANAPSMGLLGGSKSKNYIYGRALDYQNNVYLELTANSYELGCLVAGSKTVFGSSTSFTFKPGAIYWLECGTTGGLRIFRVWENSKVLLTYTDSGAVSLEGASYLNTGIGGLAYSIDYKPAKVASFAFYDNTPVAIKGCGWRVSRTNTGTDDQNSGSQVFAASWFDTVEKLSDGLVYDPVTNKITVFAEGWYKIDIVQYGGVSIVAGGGSCAARLFLNGAAVQQAAPVPQTTNTGYRGFSGSFIEYCEPGDYLQPGYNSSWHALGVMNADAGGINTYWSGAFLGNKKPN